MVMARTKKQTLENASERKRQIQEEILKETAAKRKKEDFTPYGKGIQDSPNQKSVNKIKMSSSDCALKEDLSSNGSYSANNSPIKGGEDLPKAVIFISDICKNQLKSSANQVEVSSSANKASVNLEQVLKKDVSNSCSTADKSHSPEISKGSPKSPRSSAGKKNSHNASLEMLKAVSEKVREEKSRKVKPFIGLFNGDSHCSWPKLPECCPTSDADIVQHDVPETAQQDDLLMSDDKPKVNIFTENLGVDLGKRIRSPRRLSEDMIALPIFSARKWNSPKENSLAGKSLEDYSVHNDIIQSNSPQLNESFKSPPVVYVASNRKSVSQCVKQSPPKAQVKRSLDLTSQTVKNNNNCSIISAKEESCCDPVDNCLEKVLIVAEPSDEKNLVLNKSKVNGQNMEVTRSRASLLCAMLIGGTEVANNYTQDRGKYKSEAPDGPDSEKISTIEQTHQSKSHCTSLVTDKISDEKAHLEKANNSNEKERLSDQNEVHFNEEKKMTTKNCNSVLAHEKQISEHGDLGSECKTLGRINKKIDFSNKLKLLNEDVLKLLDMDVEDEFLETSVCNTGAEHDSTSQNDSENELFHLINILGNRLSDANNDLPFSKPIDKDFVKKLLQSCPKSPSAMMKLDTMSKIEQLLKKWKEKCVSSEEKMDESKENKTSEPMNAAMDSSNIPPVSCVPSLSDMTARSLPSDNLSALDAMTVVASGAVQNSQAKSETCTAESQNTHVKRETPAESQTAKTEDLKLADMKSDIPDEVCSSESVSVSNQTGSPKKSNSSQQISSKTSSAMSTSSMNCNKENQVKSKLGSMIPVPGTSYTSRASKKTWRLPRTVLEPKPLSILSEVEETSSEPKNVFTCPNLQKYLSVPSNRMIVPTENRQEMEAIDAKAKEEQERKQTKKEEKETFKPESKCDTMFACSDPDFDEVNGVLFISFSNETELNAHLNVEKILDWDKDDTMIRISRARAFEEAKTNQQDMGQYKLKHLRGQHMRWKKYRKLFNDEFCRLSGMKENNSSEVAATPKKTSDITKIKGWRKKVGSSEFSERKKNVSEEQSQPSYNGMPSLEDSFQYERDQQLQQKEAHRKLFRQLHYDRQDRMIHRKLGGWSVKGNRPKEFSDSGRKRQVKPFCDVLVKIENVESSFGASFQNDSDKESIAKFNDSINKRDESSHLVDNKDFLDSFRRKKSLELICPVLTEGMAINALTALELNDGYLRKKHKKLKHDISVELRAGAKSLAANNQTPTLKYTTSRDLSSSSPPLSCLSPASTVNSTSMSVATTPLVVDFKDEPVCEGVEIGAGSVSSPSIADSSSVKSCSKPGCRYGCICHLCSVGDLPVASPKSKPVSMYCEKEYCRLGCICDTFDSEKPVTFRHSAMPLSCHYDMSGQDDSDDIPYLPSLKKRPKPENRFSNLPQRQRTHRASKNLDAITRKALMLYETSEIYCEKVERIRKKPDIFSSPSVMSMSGTLHDHSSLTEDSFSYVPKNEFEICTEYAEEDDSFNCFPDSKTSEALASTDVSISDMQQKIIPHLLNTSLDSYDIRKSIPLVELSTHKRKRKSHPLSGEIFPSSTCARVQPFKSQLPARISLDHQASEQSSNTVETFQPSKDSVALMDAGGLNPLKCDNECGEIDVSGLSSIKPGQDSAVLESNQEMAMPKVESKSRTKGGSSLAIIKSEDHTKPTECTVPVSYATMDSKNQVLSPGASINSGSFFTSSRQHHGWHTSMVCLKARAPPKPKNIPEDDVQEEDEVKLLEFAANCNWEGAKKEILGKVAQCLTRGQYPHPRTMNVCEFVVEILPKAQQPSLIPPELRSKLPDQMFSIRVRITRREQLKESSNVDHQVIDLSDSSPVKKNEEVCLRIPLSKGNHLQPNQKQSVLSLNSSEIPTSSTMGISGLSKLCIANQPISLSKQPYTNVIHRPFNSTAPVKAGLEAPEPRKKSLLDKQTIISKKDQYVTTTSGTQTFGLVTSKGMFTKLGTDDAKHRIVETPSGTKRMKYSNVNKLATQLVLTTSEAKYIQVPKQERIVEVFVDPPSGKKLIAVPLSLTKGNMMKGKQGSIINVPVSGNKQSNVLPPKQQSNVTTMNSNPEKSQITMNGSDSNIGVESSALVKVKDDKEQMIMVFDAAHIKPSPGAKIVMPICQDLITRQVPDGSSKEKEKTAAQVSFPQFKPIMEDKDRNVEQVEAGKDLVDCETPDIASSNSLKSVSQELVHHNYASSLSAGNLDGKCISEIPQASSKQNPTLQLVDGANIPPTKKRRFSGDNPAMLNEDSRGSAHSCSEIHPAASPASLVDRPKSVMSTSISTASTDDILIMLSSDEDIDVCDYDSEDVKKARREGVSLYKSAANIYSEPGSSQRRDVDMPSYSYDHLITCLKKKTDGHRHKKRTSVASTDKLEHHNQLERMRRFKLRTLFEDLQEQVRKEIGLPPEHVMSKAKVLIEAKKVIFKLCKKVKRGDLECKEYEKKNQDLKKTLASLKRASSARDVPNGQASLPLWESPSLPDGGDDWDNKSELVDLVSPSSEEDKFSEGVAHASEDASEPEAVQI